MDMAVHPFDPSDRNEVVLTVRTAVLRQFDCAAFDMIDHTDLFAAGRDDVHMVLDACDAYVRTLRWVAHAGLFFHELDRLFGALGDLVAHGFRRISDGVARVRGFVFDGTRHDHSPQNRYRQTNVVALFVGNRLP